MVARIKIERSALVAGWGDEAKLDAAIADFQKALVDHSKTIGVPAPTAHPWIEAIVYQSGGKYEIVEPVVSDTVSEPERALEDLQAEAFAEIAYRRKMTIDAARVSLHGVSFSASVDALNALLAADISASDHWRARWRVGPGSFVLINRDDVRELIRMIRAVHQSAFNREFELSDAIVAATTPKKLAEIDLSTGWGGE